jgi:hypothetical protein
MDREQANKIIAEVFNEIADGINQEALEKEIG